MSKIAPSPVRPKTTRIVDKEHVAFLHRLPSVISGREGEGIQVHHLMRVPTNERGAGRKSGDNWCIPLWHDEHHNLHHYEFGERRYLELFGIYGPALAALLYQLSGDETACRRVILEARNG